MGNAVEFENVSRFYGKVRALSGLTMSVPEGSVCALVGRNGAGKTTMLRMIPALIHPTTGKVRVFGLDPWRAQEEVKVRLGYLSESEEWPSQVRAQDVIDLCANLYPTWDKAMAEGLVGQFAINPRARLGALSKGQRRQVGLLCAVCHRPKLLVLDEPGGGLDPAVRRSFLEVVIKLLADSGSTVLFSSHIMSDLDRVADHIAILHWGELLLHKPVDELRENTCRVEISDSLTAAHRDRLASQSACLKATLKEGRLRATLRCSPEAAGEYLQGVFPDLPAARQASVAAMTLEDIFIELTEKIL
jgi:ABC-2 type transport system ATP-binding protein